jgi:Spy/CpxP family protein refolding chaperone
MKIRMLAALSILLVATAALAQPAPAPPPAPAPARVLAHYLELTPDQVAAWKQIHTDTATTIEPLAAAARGEQQQLAAALQAATPDPPTVGKLAITLHATREQIRTARADSRTKLMAVLTPEQKVKFEAFEAAAKAMRRGRR